MHRCNARYPGKEVGFCEGKIKAAAPGACLVVVISGLFEAPRQNCWCLYFPGYDAISTACAGTARTTVDG